MMPRYHMPMVPRPRAGMDVAGMAYAPPVHAAMGIRQEAKTNEQKKSQGKKPFQHR